MTKANFAQLDPHLLRANSWNTNKMSPDHEAKLDESLKRFKGLFKPILVREVGAELEILGGQHRWESALRLGLKTVPVFNLGAISDAEAKEISLADNARYGADDVSALSTLLQELNHDNEISTFLPYSDTELASIFQSNITLDELDLDLDPEKPEPKEEETPVKVAKTHTVMRFKVPLADAERITELISTTKHDYGFNTSDELTNAGDALVHLLLQTGETDDAA